MYKRQAITTNPSQISDDLKRNNGFIPGIKPGANTSEYLDKVMSKLLFPGSLIIAFIAVLPAIVKKFGIGQEFAQFFGGTSLLIIVGVILDTIQQINSYLLMHKYDGMMKSGKLNTSDNYSIAG